VSPWGLCLVSPWGLCLVSSDVSDILEPHAHSYSDLLAWPTFKDVVTMCLTHCHKTVMHDPMD
jgi:hypothetical protein